MIWSLSRKVPDGVYASEGTCFQLKTLCFTVRPLEKLELLISVTATSTISSFFFSFSRFPPDPFSDTSFLLDTVVRHLCENLWEWVIRSVTARSILSEHPQLLCLRVCREQRLLSQYCVISSRVSLFPTTTAPPPPPGLPLLSDLFSSRPRQVRLWSCAAEARTHGDGAAGRTDREHHEEQEEEPRCSLIALGT